jgi:mannitol/fructose-specific phosphotransferase system IIA component (Ntr-type)
MTLLDILQPACVRAPLQASDKRACIEELVDLMAGVGAIADPKALKDAVWTREQTRTTGIGHGLAIPHGKCPGVTGLVMAVGKPPEPIEFGAIDGKPVRLIIMLASAPERNSDHIQALARVSRIMMMNEFRERIYAAATGPEVYELLKEQELR